MLTLTKCKNLPCRKPEPTTDKPRGIQVPDSPATLTALLTSVLRPLPCTRAAPLPFGKAIVIIDFILSSAEHLLLPL